MSDYKKVVLRPKKDEFLKRFHPWVFSGAVASIAGGVEEGDNVRVISHDGDFLGVGHYQIGSIAVRILSFDDVAIDKDYYVGRLKAAYDMRRQLNLIRDDNNTFRLVHGEGDGLPGLIIDVYGNTLVMQSHSVGIHKDRFLIVDALREVMPEDSFENLYYKSESTLPFKAGLEPENDYIIGGNDVDEFAVENGFKFKIDWLKGQKTGFFIDQRENRKLLQQYAKGRRLLNMFSYTGGFSVYGLAGGAEEVVSVDSSAKAVSIANLNVQENFGSDDRHISSSEDAFKYLANMPYGKYDLIVLDPPAFAKHRGALKNALQGYKRLNQAALEKIASGGVLFTFSCSQVVSPEQFRLAVMSACALTKRNVRILHQLTQPADHPVNIYHPEGEYLKGLVMYVE